MKKFVRESLKDKIEELEHENDELQDEVDALESELEDDSDVDVEDEWEKPEEDDVPDEIDVDTSDMESEEIEAEPVDNDGILAIDNELKVPEFNRAEIEFKLKNKPGVLSGVPMAKLNGNNYIFKVDGMMRKFNLKDIVIITEGLQVKKKVKLNERLKDGYEYEYVDYLFDIAAWLVDVQPEAVQAILNIHNVYNTEEAKIDITNELEDNETIYHTKEMYDQGIEVEEAVNRIIDAYNN